MTSPPPPGWYPDPANAASQRWWDGNAWGPIAPTPSTPQVWPTAAVRRAPREFGVAYVLGVFVIGAHRMYLGKVSSGVAMCALWYVGLLLVLIGLPGPIAWVPVAALLAVFVWWIVDLARMRALVDRANSVSQ